MSLIDRLQRMQRMHELIKYKRTGPPLVFARKIGVSRSMLYILIRDLKSLGAPVRYCKYRESYQYQYEVELKIGFVNTSLEPLQAHNR